MRAVMSLGEIKELLRSEKAIKIIFAAGAALIVILAFGGLFGGSRSGNTVTALTAAEELAGYGRALEQRLTDILGEIEGVGELRVMVTLDTTEQTEYGRSADMRLSVTAPRVRGVIVVCDGGDSVTVKEKVIAAVTGVFGINTLRVSVMR